MTGTGKPGNSGWDFAASVAQRLRAPLAWIAALAATGTLAFLAVVFQVLATTSTSRVMTAKLGAGLSHVIPPGFALPGYGPWPDTNIPLYPLHLRSSVAQPKQPALWEQPLVAVKGACVIGTMHAIEPSAWKRMATPIRLERRSKFLPPRRVTEISCGRPIDWSEDPWLEVAREYALHWARFVWLSTPLWYLAWHLGAVGAWRISRHIHVARVRRQVDLPRSPACSIPGARQLWVSALITAPLPAIGEGVYGFWLGAARAHLSAHPDSNGLSASVGPAGYTGMWIGVAALHVLAVHAAGVQKLRTWWWIAIVAGIGLLNAPIVLGWAGRLMPADWVMRYIPY